MRAEIIKISSEKPEASLIRYAAEQIRAGEVLGMPTDTFYGLAADPFHTGASDRLFALKRRPRSVELPVLVASEEEALTLTIAVPAAARRLMASYWPGALTLVLPRRPDLNADLGDDDATVGLRCPGHPVPLALCNAVGPLATTSANRHGDQPATTASELASAFGAGVALILDAGVCNRTASTVVDCTGEEPRLLREGQLPWAELAKTAAGQGG